MELQDRTIAISATQREICKVKPLIWAKDNNNEYKITFSSKGNDIVYFRASLSLTTNLSIAYYIFL